MVQSIMYLKLIFLGCSLLTVAPLGGCNSTEPSPKMSSASANYYVDGILKDDLVPSTEHNVRDWYRDGPEVNETHEDNPAKANQTVHAKGWFDILFKDRSDAAKRERQQQIRYFLKRKTHPGYVLISNDGSGTGSNWTPGGAVHIIIHGFTPSGTTPEEKIGGQGIYKIGNAYAQQNSSNNIIIVDWTALSNENEFYYSDVIESALYADEAIANFVLDLSRRHLDGQLDDVHLIGYSLGAHVAGGVGERVRRKGKKLGRITGIDPSGRKAHVLGFLPSDTSHILDEEDAAFVTIVHCDLGFAPWNFGTPAQCGTVDFYPNGGSSQKGCDLKYGCSHWKCPEIFEKSINTKYLACPCSDWGDFQKGLCQCSITNGGAYLGEQASKNSSGRYYLNWD